jgi:hypothetical protein
MLNLKNVTLLCIDVINPGRSIEALLASMNLVDFAEVVLATDLRRHQTLKADCYGIRLHGLKESDTKIEGPTRHYFVDYEKHVLTVPFEVMRTDYVLYQEWDGCVVNPNAWDGSWLRTDYIGALWTQFYEPGWPPTDKGMRVGNSGFSLRSRRFCQLIRQAAIEWHDDPGMMSCDQWMCRTMRPWLESNGMAFATEDQALKFSCEDAIYTGQFGFHGKKTAKINGWWLPWFDK